MENVVPTDSRSAVIRLTRPGLQPFPSRKQIAPPANCYLAAITKLSPYHLPCLIWIIESERQEEIRRLLACLPSLLPTSYLPNRCRFASITFAARRLLRKTCHILARGLTGQPRWLHRECWRGPNCPFRKWWREWWSGRRLNLSVTWRQLESFTLGGGSIVAIR